MRIVCSAVAASLFASGCVSLPEFGPGSGVTPKTVVGIIECELIRVRKRIDDENVARRKGGDNQTLEDLHGWFAVADLALQVDEQATLTPAFTHSGVVSKSLAHAFDWGAKFDTQAQRVYNQTVTFNIAELQGKCGPEPIGTSSALQGSLGLDEILSMAFDSANAKGISLGRGGDNDDDDGSGRRPKRKKSKKDPKPKSQSAFGTTIEFVVVKGVGASGPTWTLSHFKGPGKLFTVQRSDTHRVQISFARNEKDAKAYGANTVLQNLPKAAK